MKKLIALLAAGVLAAAIVGCGNKDEGATTDNGATAGTTGAAPASTAGAPAPASTAGAPAPAATAGAPAPAPAAGGAKKPDKMKPAAGG